MWICSPNLGGSRRHTFYHNCANTFRRTAQHVKRTLWLLCSIDQQFKWDLLSMNWNTYIQWRSKDPRETGAMWRHLVAKDNMGVVTIKDNGAKAVVRIV